jgi:HEAT repeat protein
MLERYRSGHNGADSKSDGGASPTRVRIPLSPPKDGLTKVIMERRKLLTACLLKALGAALLILIDTYANALFLSAYSKNMLPYFYFALAIFGFMAMQLSQPYLKKGLSQFLRWSHLFLIAICILFIFLAGLSYYWLPFIVAVVILTASTIAGASNFITILNFFSMREYKGITRWMNISSLVGLVAMGILIPILLKYFSLTVLLYLIAGAFVALLLVYSLLHFPPEKHETTRHSPPPVKLFREKLFIFAFLIFLMMMTLTIFSDFSLKSELARLFTQNEIGQFLSAFFVITTIGYVVLQIFVLPPLLRRTGVIGILLICPIGFIPLAILMFIYPGLWTVTLLTGLGLVLRMAFFVSGNQMLLNVYAPAVRNIAQYQLLSLGRLAMGLSAILLLGLTLLGSLRIIAVAILVASLLLIYLCLRVGKYYFSTLKTAINLRRFDAEYLESEMMDQEITMKVASQALASEQEEIQLFGLSLFRKINIKKTPVRLLEALSSKWDLVREGAISVLKSSQDQSAVAPLMRGLSEEKNPELIWRFVETLVHFSPECLLPYASAVINAPNSATKASAAHVFYSGGNEAQLKQAEATFLFLLNSENDRDRYWAANVLREGAVKNPGHYISQLVNDSNEEVVRNALLAARFHSDDQIIYLLIHKLENKALAFSVGNTLVAIGSRAISPLLSYLHKITEPRQINLVIILFSKFLEPSAEAALLGLLQGENANLIGMAAMSLAYRVKQFSLSEQALGVVHEQAFKEIEKIADLKNCLRFYQDPDILNEIQSRIYYAQKRYLYLLASYGEAKTILQIIPTLLSSDKKSRAYDSAMELLELCIPDPSLKNTISVAFEGAEKSSSVRNEGMPPKDHWLKQVIEFKQGIKQGDSMDELIEKILVLRKVSLFSSLSAELLQSIAEIVQQEDIAAQQIIFKEGEMADGMYIVVKGGINIIKNEQVINFCTAGAFFGELALLDDAPRYASATAQEDTQLFFIEKSDFNRLTDEVPEILKAVTQTIIGYLRKTEPV